jgi:hypothetical protein
VTDTRATTTALGGQRQVPVPDPVARDYLLLALRLDQHVPGLVDGYFGPADLKAQVDVAPIPSPARLRDDARALRERLPAEIDAPDRREWLDAQLVALETQAAALAGEPLPYVEHLRRCFTIAPERRDPEVFEQAAAELDELLPGAGSLADRLAAWDDRFTIDPDRLPSLVDWLAGRFRERAFAQWGLPEGEGVRVSLVRNQPWTGYNWYDGGFRSRVDLNLDLPIRADALVHVIGHETYSGHHLEHAWREAEQVVRLGRMEASILLINTPECLVSEGLADLGIDVAMGDEERVALLVELYDRAGLRADRADAERQVAMARPRRRLNETRVNAALLRNADGLGHDEVLAWLRETGRFTPEAAEKRLEFIEHPLWRTYVFVYHEGEALLRRWVDRAPDGYRAARFGRLLREPLTPAAIAAELATGATARP